jgi:hypothetical protein
MSLNKLEIFWTEKKRMPTHVGDMVEVKGRLLEGLL